MRETFQAWQCSHSFFKNFQITRTRKTHKDTLQRKWVRLVKGKHAGNVIQEQGCVVLEPAGKIMLYCRKLVWEANLQREKLFLIWHWVVKSLTEEAGKAHPV